jgi:hypothetical protein
MQLFFHLQIPHDLLFLSHLQMRPCLSFTNTARFVIPSSLPIYKCGTICY